MNIPEHQSIGILQRKGGMQRLVARVESLQIVLTAAWQGDKMLAQ
jgi:hypothetical protein